MNKLFAKLKSRFPELSEDDIRLSIETMIEGMSSQLARGGRIELRGFGSFSINRRMKSADESQLTEDAHMSKIPEVRFKPGLVIRKRLLPVRHLD